MSLLAGRYNPIGLAHSGGQGSAVVCHDLLLERDVIIKRLHKGISATSLKKEISIRQSVTSNYIAQIYDFFIGADGEPQLVIEYISGEELSSNNLLPIDEDEYLLKLLYQLACGINDFHQAGIVHRDIKPHNCRLDAEGILRIFDLGLSTNLAETEITEIGAGTPGFLAPELYDFGEKPVSPAIDAYAWGATAWFLVTCGLPPALISVPPQSKNLVQTFASQTKNTVLAEMVDRSLLIIPTLRPAISEIVSKLRAELTFGLHKGILINGNGKEFLIDKTNPKISVESTNCKLNIHYNGYGFNISDCKGDVFVNNEIAVAGAAFPDACVVTFGGPQLGPYRSYLNFCSTHPEVIA